ncbi:MAG: hypothetical protein NTZ80_00525, partial [Patescibacteria group bacterium]|nr:hypothetical protein [Patescibacteria group bacterium]
MSRLRRFLFFDLLLEATFWIGGLLGIIFGLAFAQRKGTEFREKIAKEWKKQGFQGARKAMSNELKDSGKEAWTSAKNNIAQSEAYKKASQKTAEIWDEVDDDTKEMLKRGAKNVSRAAKTTFAKIKENAQRAMDSAEPEISRIAGKARLAASRQTKKIVKNTVKKAVRIVKKA